jgi:hypothetical protein
VAGASSHRCWAALVLGLLGLSSRMARADASSPTLEVALHWQVPAGCVEPEALESNVEQALERNVFVDAPESKVTLHVVSRDAAGRDLELRVLQGERLLGSRSLVAEADCQRFGETLALVVSMMIETAAEKIAEPRAEPARRSIDGEPRDRPAPPAPPPARPERHVIATALARADVGTLPGPAVGARLDGAVEGKRWRMHAALEASPGTTLEEDDGSIDFRAEGGALGVGLRLDLGPSLRVLPRLELGLSAVHARASGFAQAFSAWQALATVAADARLELDLIQPLFVAIELGVRLAYVRPEFQYRSSEGALSRAYRSDLVSTCGSLGLGLRF